MQRIMLNDNIALTCVTTDRFKTHVLTAFLIRQLRKDEASLNALLPQVLRRGNKKYPTLTAMSNRLADLYGAGLSGEVRKRGEHHCIGLAADFIDVENLGGATETLFGTLLEPVFSDEYVLSERGNLINKIRALKNSKSAYASMRHNALAFDGEPYGTPRLGDEDAGAVITPDALRTHYENILKTSAIELFYCGEALPDAVASLISSRLNFKPQIPVENPTKLLINEKQRQFVENQDMSQAQISIIWRTEITAKNPDSFAANLASVLYGGSTTSKLFTHVRERLSLCYTTNSHYDRHKGMLKAQSGVEAANLDRARDEMLTQWSNVVSGNFTDEELCSAKSVIISELKSVSDSPAALESFWQGQSVCHMSSTPNDWISAINRVTKDDIIRVANSITLDSTYYLRAEQ